MSVAKLRSEVVDTALCAGCGACGLACPQQLIAFDPDRVEPRLQFDTAACGDCTVCLDVCPGSDPGTLASELALFGRGRRPEERWLGIHGEIYGARACDGEVLRRAASGGVVTTLLLASRQRFGVEQVLTMGRERREGWRARGEVSNHPETIVGNAQSTYQLAPYLTSLRPLFEHHPEQPVAVAGIACHMQAIRKLQRLNSPVGEWARRRIVLLVELACSSNTLPAGTSSLITDVLGTPRDQVVDVKYREGTYPGRFQITKADGERVSLEFWQTLAVLKQNKTHRCLSCGDWMSGLADISVCDGEPNIFDASLNPGDTTKHSRVLIRTEQGRELWEHCTEQALLESWPITFDGFNLGLERKRNRRRHYEQAGGALPAGPGVEDAYDPAELQSDEQLIDPARYRREAR